ncbi:MAG: GDP-mannose 4,6-dehydratase [Candidatus Lokiarchaeota archaeon]|nr:GDP-mannose 4,6-dehydratase [Candidatus Lokiarchaeota archaeon]
MSKNILVTGGAGFIGSHLVDTLIEKGHEVTVLDSLDKQVHGNKQEPPLYLNKDITFIHESVENYDIAKKLIQDHDVIYHLASIVGVGQSMYEIERYVKKNMHGTSVLLDILANCEHSTQKVIIASSNTIYGEGSAKCNNCGIVKPDLRSESQLSLKDWNIYCPKCKAPLKPILTPESRSFNSSSIYALSKQVQEQMGLLIGKTYGINTTALRFFLVYGPRQALSNPYTGVCSIFTNRALKGETPLIFEDGLQTRDFVNVKDVCQALVLAMEKKNAEGEVFNVGTGCPTTIKQVAEIILEKTNPNLKPIITQKYRTGDIRHCVADISKIKNKLGYEPSVDFREGIVQLIEWIKKESSLEYCNNINLANEELEKKGLIK